MSKTLRVREGDRVKVFDPFLWNGRDCKCGCKNDCFRKPATVINTYSKYRIQFADVRFDHRGESRGHLVSLMDDLGTRVQA